MEKSLSNYPKVVLVGHRDSQKIVPASKFLTAKYMPMFDFTYLNYRDGINGWAGYVVGFLKYLTDEYVMFALDDYFLSDYIDIEAFEQAMVDLDESREEAACVKLCASTLQEHEEYPCTTQYCIWNREFLIWILEQVHSPWQFEIEGSKLFKASGMKSIHRPCLEYNVHSVLSSRWEGLNLKGLNEEDLNYLKANGLI